MCITEYNDARFRDEVKEEGREEGLVKGRVELLVELVKDGILSAAEAASRAHMDVAEFEAKTGLKA